MESQQSIQQKKSPPDKLNGKANSVSPRIRIESVGRLTSEKNGKMNSMESLSIAAKNCLDKSSYDSSEINLLIYNGVYRSEYLLEPAYASLLAGELDMNATALGTDSKKTLAFDIFNGSVGFLNACYVAQQMMLAKDCNSHHDCCIGMRE
jgi:3-oxoacyl-[acyl-carrier-protein] synthase III